MFDPLPSRFDFPAAEQRVLEFWERHDVFGQSLKLREGRPRFVFYEGPPTANGLPHPGHCLTRAIKDLFPRYKAMCGYLVERKGGWDTHGLPVEVEVCKELGIHTKPEIENYGVEKFVQRCLRSVWRYTREWEELTRRLGFWVNLEEAYATYHRYYVESVWWSLKTLFERGLLYQGHKVVWWWCQGGTALSSGEVGEGYRTIDDPSVFVKFPVVEGSAARPRTSLLVWTTTPWTLISNHFAAVHPDLEYALVEDPGAESAEPEYLYIAAALVATIARKIKRELTIVSTCRGADLIGLRYLPPFPEAYHASHGGRTARLKNAGRSPSSGTEAAEQAAEAAIGWRVLPADFVTLESGTGLVHEAPAFGEVDFNLLQDERQRFADPDAIPLLCAVNPDGTFNHDAPPQYRGRMVFDCDRDIIRELRERRTPWGTPLLYHQELVRHEYPFCPRAEEDKLIQYARKSWFVRTSQFKQEFLRNNAAMNWLPEHIRDGRMGDFLRNNVDWALSRERYWGTPLPIWVCEKCGRMEAIGSLAELRARPGATDATEEYPQGFWEAKVAEHRAAGEELPEHLRVHKPYIDAWTYPCPACQEERHRQQGPGDGEPEKGAGRSSARPGPPRMRRVPEVIDCWWDAGSMPFAQWGFPHAPGSIERFRERFPADFISEAIDQTRGWFYGLLAISTLLFAPAGATLAAPADAGAASYPLPFRTCIVLGHIAGEDGNKMSKRLRNYKEPGYIFDTYGADAMRWFFFSAQPPWTSVRFQEAAIRDSQREFLLKLYNVLSFFTIYANIDGFDPRRVCGPETPDGFEAGPAPAQAGVGGGDTEAAAAPSAAHHSTPAAATRGWRPPSQRTELDRWIITELRRTVRAVRESMDRFENFPAAQRLTDFVDALSNWYVRRSRDRFWRPLEHSAPASAGAAPAPEPSACGPGPCSFSTSDQEKWDAYHTLYGCLRVLSRLIAPFTPFFAETMYQHLRVPGDPISVHLCDYPSPEEIRFSDESLTAAMDLVREIASLGRAARAAASPAQAGTDPRVRKVRQPLARVEIILARPEHLDALRSHAGLIAEELNVKTVEFTGEAEHYVTYKVQPNFKVIGSRYRELVPAIKQALAEIRDAAGARKLLLSEGHLPLHIAGRVLHLTRDEVEIRLEARPGWSAAQGRAGVVVISTELTPELIEEGLIRELVHQVQSLRKQRELPYEARIRLAIRGSREFLAILTRHEATVRSECLVSEVLADGTLPGPASRVELEGHVVEIQIERV